MSAPAASSNPTAQFLSALYPAKYPQNLTLNVRALAHHGRGRVIEDYYGCSDELLADGPHLLKWQAEERSIYFGAALRQGFRGNTDGCVLLPGLWADLDAKGFVDGPLTEESVERGVAILRERLAQALPPEHQPTLLVHTGGGLQAYWLFKEPLLLAKPGTPERDSQIARIEGVLRGLHLKVGCQPERQDVASILRLPGFINPKYPWKPLARLTLVTDRRFSLNDLSGYAAASEPSEPTRARQAADPDLDLVAAFRERGLYKGPGKSGRHRVVCPWLSEHTTEDGPSSTVILAPDAAHAWWGFSCGHGHCEGRGISDVLALFWPSADDRENDPVATPGTNAPCPAISGGSLTNGTGPDAAVMPEPTAREEDAARPRFPVDVFPGWMRDHAEQAAEELQVPLDMQAVFDLGALAVASFRKVRIEMSPTWILRPNLYAGVFGASGAGKSPSLREATRGIRAAVSKGRRTMKKRAKDSEFELDLLQSQYAAMKDKAIADGTVEKDTEALRDLHARIQALKGKKQPEFLLNDVTPEALTATLGRSYGRAALISEEASEVFEILGGRYSQGKAAIEVWLKSWDGGAIDMERVDSGRSVHLDDPHIAAVVTTHFSTLRNLGGDVNLQGRGLMGRWLYSLPESIVGHRNPNPREMDAITREVYHDTLIGVMAMEKELTLTLSEVAKAEWRTVKAWVEQLMAELPDTEENEILREWLAKAATTCARLAALLHIAEHAEGGIGAAGLPEIPLEAVQKAKRLVQGYFWPHFQAAMKVAGLTGGPGQARRDWQELTKAGLKMVTVRDLSRGAWRRMKAGQIQDRLVAMEEAGYADVTDSTGDQGPRNKGSVYRLKARE